MAATMITRIISGGQTGADQAALDAAIKNDVPHGGWIPKGRMTESGPLPKKYQLLEMASQSYPERTEQNVLDSDGTLVVSHGRITGGTALTRELAEKHGKPCLLLDMDRHSLAEAVEQVSTWVRNNDIGIMNVAGSRASHDPEIYQATFSVLDTFFKNLDG